MLQDALYRGQLNVEVPRFRFSRSLSSPLGKVGKRGRLSPVRIDPGLATLDSLRHFRDRLTHGSSANLVLVVRLEGTGVRCLACQTLRNALNSHCVLRLSERGL